jgi:hypothetical protein
VIGAVVGGGRDHAAAVGIPATRPGRPDRRRSQTALFTHVSESADDQSQTLVMDESRVPGPPRHARIRPRADREAPSASDARNSSSAVVCDASAEMTACDEKAQVRGGIEGSSETVEPSRGQRERYPGRSLVGHARASWSPTRMPATRSEITGRLPLGCGDGALERVVGVVDRPPRPRPRGVGRVGVSPTVFRPCDPEGRHPQCGGAGRGEVALVAGSSRGLRGESGGVSLGR